MIIDEKKTEKVGKEAYVEPMLTKHDALHALTGASAVLHNACLTDPQLCT